MNAREEIRMIAVNLATGESDNRQLCPNCNGGRNKRRAFSVTRTNTGILFNCYRDACGFKGFINESGVTTVQVTYKPDRSYRDSLYMLTTADCDFFEKRFNINKPSEYFAYNDRDHYVHEVKGTTGERLGYVERNNNWDDATLPEELRPPRRQLRNDTPKSKTYPERDVSLVYHYERSQSIPESLRLVIVEDYLSAIRLAERGYNACALLGTHLSMELAGKLQRTQPRWVVLATDSDATASAFKIAREYGTAFPHLRVAILDKDIKDMHDAEIAEAIGGLV